MVIEKEQNNIMWLKDELLKIRVEKDKERSKIAVTFDKYNLCLKLVMFEFIKYAKEEVIIDVSVDKIWNNQRVFITDLKNTSSLVNYIVTFIKEWDIRASQNTNSDSDIISDDLWYGHD